MRTLLLLLCSCLLLFDHLQAQNRTITGKITDNNGRPVPGASVTIKSTRRGTSSGPDGVFSIPVPPNSNTLVISAVGWTSKEVEIGDQTSITVTLTAKENTLSEVVVTSLGIARDKRSLGYATQQLKADQIADKGQVNLVSAMEGKVAGVNITGASGGAGASVNINIRGITSFTRSNQPLFVVDGIPISNDVDRTNGGPNGTLGDQQPANRALDLDLNNIESINILKGPAAAVLYGSRAAAGAIIITTKKGGVNGKSEIVASTAYSQQYMEGLPQVQNAYGQGSAGIYNPASGNSWGPKFGSTPSVANGLLVNGQPVPFKAYPNNINDFFQTGTISDNSLIINGGDAKQNFTLSGGYLTQNGILPNTSLKRANVKFAGNTIFRNKIKVGGVVSFFNTLQTGILDGNGASSLAVVEGLARSIDLTSTRVLGTYQNPDGTNNWPIPGQDNPYYDAYMNPLKSNLYRIIGNVNLGYDLFPWLNINYRLGIDAYTDRRKQIFAISSARVPAGQDLESDIYRSELNGDLIITAHKNDFLTKDLNFSALLGQNINQRRFQVVTVEADALAFSGFYNTSVGSNFAIGSAESTTLQRLLGYYGQLSFAWRGYLYLEATARADESSTLSTSKNTFFYPSVNAGFVFTDAFHINSGILSYGKLRANISKVGTDAPPYLLANTYQKSTYGNNVANFSFPDGAIAGFTLNPTIAPNVLSPEFVTSYEIGTNLGFWNNRATLDATYYNTVSTSQIFSVGIPPSTGFTTKTVNAGKMTNKGVELTLSVEPVVTHNFRWDIIGNFTRNVNKVVSIFPGITRFSIPGSAFIGSIPSIQVGQPYGVIIGGLIPRDSTTGARLINPGTGVYATTIANQVLANPNPDYILGISNTVRYKSLSLGFTFNFIKGGQVLSFTAASYKSRGAWVETGKDRDKPWTLPGEILSNGKYTQNNIQIPAQTYWQTLGGLQSEFNVYDATVLRLQDVTLGYDLPASIIKSWKINYVRISVFANNVFHIAPNTFIDPEINTQGAGNIRGLDLQGTPNARTIGGSLKVSF
ncbi:SusC/RagA family TonB-linked outer membrane protein [Puia dinghuensis]|uniref:SusC/RagA family TonB-linked outer membrane protein n=1 Tax=Puia dinghuensis TaxID=1792502 RepID=A0A8J2U945_9BACT|nr:SusC/RagA family TonB-linked outer membrane protein [Puia dinghuensis]GGA87674.1 SusC/RagA family TonB-linked outer membrane protein [Puia dinghuensis]